LPFTGNLVRRFPQPQAPDPPVPAREPRGPSTHRVPHAAAPESDKRPKGLRAESTFGAIQSQYLPALALTVTLVVPSSLAKSSPLSMSAPLRISVALKRPRERAAANACSNSASSVLPSSDSASSLAASSATGVRTISPSGSTSTRNLTGRPAVWLLEIAWPYSCNNACTRLDCPIAPWLHYPEL
jgi:hypothetical protein